MMMRATRAVVCLALLTLLLSSGCSDDSGTKPTADSGKRDTSTSDLGVADKGATDKGAADKGAADKGAADQGGGMALPQTVTMSAGIGGTEVSAQICMSLGFGGSFVYSLASNSASPCIGGEIYLTFALNPTSSVYRVGAGYLLLSDGGLGDAVKISSTSEGSVTQDVGGADQVTGLPENTDITIATQGHSKVSFSFAGNDVTLKAFE